MKVLFFLISICLSMCIHAKQGYYTLSKNPSCLEMAIGCPEGGTAIIEQAPGGGCVNLCPDKNEDVCTYISTSVIYPRGSQCGQTPACIGAVFCERFRGKENVKATAMCEATNGRCPPLHICMAEQSPSWIDGGAEKTKTLINKKVINSMSQ